VILKRGQRRPQINAKAMKQIAKKIQDMTLRIEFSD